MNNKNIQGLEKEFDEEFSHVGWIPENKAHLLAFISTLLTQARKEEREEMRKVVENMSYVGVLDSNEKRRGYDIAREEALSALNKRDE